MVNVGRDFHLTCLSVGDFSGTVVWMKAGESIPTIGLYSFIALFIQFMTNFFSALFDLFRYCEQSNHYS